MAQSKELALRMYVQAVLGSSPRGLRVASKSCPGTISVPRLNEELDSAHGVHLH